MAATRTKAFSYILGGLLLAVGQPAISALTDPGQRFYMLQPLIYIWQPIPYVVAAALWLPWGSARAARVGLVLARLLFVCAALFYIPIMTGLVGSGSDMVVLGYILFSIVTTAAVLLATLIGFATSWIRRPRAGGAEQP